MSAARWTLVAMLASCSAGALEPIGSEQDAAASDAAASCEAAPPGTLCDDGDPCSAEDRCIAGVCAAAAFLDCDDGDPCTLDGCASGQGCVHSSLQPCPSPRARQ